MEDREGFDYKMNLPLLEIDLQMENLKTQVTEAKYPQLYGISKGGSIGCRPTFYGDCVFVGACDGILYCLNLVDGKEKWRFQTGDVLPESPSVNNGRLYFACFDSNFYCLDLDGKLVWKFKADSSIATSKIYNNSVYTGSKDGVLYSISLDSHLNWIFKTNEPIGSNIEADEDGIYFGCYDNKLYHLSHDGKLKWSYKLPEIPASPTLHKGNIYFGCYDNHLYCLSKNGEFKWKLSIGDATGQAPEFPIVDDVLYTTTWKGEILAIDLTQRKVLWRYKTGDIAFAKPVIVDGKVYAGSADSNFYCLDAKTGALIWKYTTGDPLVSTAGFYKGNLYFGTWYGKVISISKDGVLNWKFQTSMPMPSQVNVQKKFELKRIIKESEITPETFKINYVSLTSKQNPDTGKNIYGGFSSHYTADSKDYTGTNLNIGLGGQKRRGYR